MKQNLDGTIGEHLAGAIDEQPVVSEKLETSNQEQLVKSLSDEINSNDDFLDVQYGRLENVEEDKLVGRVISRQSGKKLWMRISPEDKEGQKLGFLETKNGGAIPIVDSMGKLIVKNIPERYIQEGVLQHVVTDKLVGRVISKSGKELWIRISPEDEEGQIVKFFETKNGGAIEIKD